MTVSVPTNKAIPKIISRPISTVLNILPGFLGDGLGMSIRFRLWIRQDMQKGTMRSLRIKPR